MEPEYSTQLQNYRIFCIIPGEPAPFAISIASNELIEDLKNKIRECRFDRFKDVPTPFITLYQVDIPADHNLLPAVQDKLGELPESTGSLFELSDIYPSAPPKKTLHFIVQVLKQARPRTPENNKTREGNSKFSPRTPEKDWCVKRESKLRELFKEYLDNDVQLPLWEPKPSLYQSHIAELKLPKLSRNADGPSLLLHNLGSTSHDPGLEGRVESLFSDDDEIRFLCNTSGAGKTRLLLEGLCRKWGFYFTARNEPDRIGSSDLSFALEHLESLKILTGNNDEDTLKENRLIARHIFSLLLYIRMFIFRIYLETASSQPGGLAETHKRKWLLLQVAPRALLLQDPFHGMLTTLWKMKQDDIDEGIAEEKGKLEKFQNIYEELFCVLDEGQIPATLFYGYFLSSDKQERPILREVTMEWTKYFTKILISGTGMSMREVQTVVGSAVGKAPGSVVVTDIGTFDTEILHRSYLELYFPPGLLGESLFSKLHYWLRGRHRFTATYLDYLIQENFNNPFEMLDRFIFGMTRFKTNPSVEKSLVEPNMSLSFPNLSKACKKDPPLLGILASFLWEYVFTGKIRGLSGPYGHKMVEFGLSRFQKPKQGGANRYGDAETDEPLAILGLMTYMSKNGFSLERCLEIPLNDAEPSPRGFAFEPFCAFTVARTFGQPRCLSDIFNFIGECSFKNERAVLVALRRQGDTFSQEILSIDSNIISNHRLGRSPANVLDTLEWLQDPEGTAICFPHKDVGPDIILVFRLTDRPDGSNNIIIVCIQCKHKNKLDAQETRSAIKSTYPANFVSGNYNGKPEWRAKFDTAIKQLGYGTTYSDPLGVMEVLISYPAVPDRTALIEASREKGRIIATVDLGELKEKESLLGAEVIQTITSLGSARVLGDGEKKRKHNADNNSTPLVPSVSKSEFQSRSDSQANKRQKTSK